MTWVRGCPKGQMSVDARNIFSLWLENKEPILWTRRHTYEFIQLTPCEDVTISIYSWGTWGSEKYNDLPQTTQHSLLSRHCFFPCTAGSRDLISSEWQGIDDKCPGPSQVMWQDQLPHCQPPRLIVRMKWGGRFESCWFINYLVRSRKTVEECLGLRKTRRWSLRWAKRMKEDSGRG